MRGRRWREVQERALKEPEPRRGYISMSRSSYKWHKLQEREQKAYELKCRLSHNTNDLINTDPGKLGAVRDVMNKIMMYGSTDSYCCSHCFRSFDANNLDQFVSHVSFCKFSFDSDGLHIYHIKELKKVLHKEMMSVMIRFHEMATTERQLHLHRKYRRDRLPWRKKGIVIMYISDGRPIGMIVTELVTLPAHPTTNYFYCGSYKCYVLLHEFSLVAYSRRHGLGKEMFDTMLDYYKTTPNDILYYYPSTSFVGFIKKWYGVKILNVLDS